MNGESISDDLDRFSEVYGDLDLTVLDTDKWYPVFVYGTMRRQGRNEHRLRERKDAYARYIGLTSTKDYTFHLNARTTGHGYMAPVAKLGGKASIRGEFWEVRHTVLLELDMFEGHPTIYRREMIPLTYGRHAWMYLYTGDISELTVDGVCGHKQRVEWWVGK